MLLLSGSRPMEKVTVMTWEEADKQTGERICSGAALNAPEHWDHKQYRLTITTPDTYDYEEDDMKVLATTIYPGMRSEDYMPDNIFFAGRYV